MAILRSIICIKSGGGGGLLKADLRLSNISYFGPWFPYRFAYGRIG